MIPFTITVEKNIGDSLTFAPGALSELSYVLSTSFDGDFVQSDEISAVVRQTDPDWLSRWNGVTRNSPVWLSRAGTNPRLEKFYFKSIQRIAKFDFRLTAQSPLGRLTSDFPGDIYNGAPLPRVLAAVIGDIVPYSVNPLLESVRVYGWTPYQSRRETLHALALAFGFLIRRDENQNLYFTVPDTSPYTIPDNAIFTGGSVAYRVGETYRRADITACDYLLRDADEQTLFDNSGASPADNLIVKFNAPMFDLRASDDLTVHDSGVNYARVSGVGVLSGRPYTKITSVVSVEGDPDADPEHILSVTDAPLITSLNAVSVGERLLAYNNAPAVVSADIVRTSQRPGDYVSFTDPFGDPQTGYITALSGSITSLDRASASVVCGYVPTWGAAYDSVSVLTGSGQWETPAYLDGKTLRVVLIGGGTGGASGQHGTDKAAVGSGRGLPGPGGNVLDVKFTARAGTVYHYAAGSGGAGGVYSGDIASGRPDSMTVYVTRTGDRWHINPHCNGGTYTPTTLQQAVAKHLSPCENCVRDNVSYYVSNPGQPGSASTFGDYSSEDGRPANFGFYDSIDAVQYALPGPDNGVDGGLATTGTENGDKENPGYTDLQRFPVSVVSPPWDSAQSWNSGAPGNGWHERTSTPEGPLYEWAYGGLGGGAAVGNNGSDGGNARFTTGVYGGDGGNGADASAIFPNDTRAYGSGGSGGHGGGESSTGGSAHSDYSPQRGADGSGGSGSNGQDGVNGCILLYFKKPNAYQYSFSVRDGRLVLTYYTAEPPPFAVNQNRHLTYTYSDSDTPPTLQVRNKHLYLSE